MNFNLPFIILHNTKIMSNYLCGLPTCTVNQNRGKHGIIKSIQKYFPISFNSNNTQILKQKRSLKYIHKNKQKISQNPRQNKLAQYTNKQQVDQKIRLIHKNENSSLLTGKIAQIKDCQLDKNRRKYINTYYNELKNNISSFNISDCKQPNLINFQSKGQSETRPAPQRIYGLQTPVSNNYGYQNYQSGFFKRQAIILNKLSNKTKSINQFHKPQIQQVKSQKYIETNFVSVINQLPVSPRFIETKINQLPNFHFYKKYIIQAKNHIIRQQGKQLQKTRTTMFSSKMSQLNPNILSRQTKKTSFCTLKQNNRTTEVHKYEQFKKQNKIQLRKNELEYQNPFRQILDNKINLQKMEYKNPLLSNQKFNNFQIKQDKKNSDINSINYIKDTILNKSYQLKKQELEDLKQSKLKLKQKNVQEAVNIKPTNSIIQDQALQQLNKSFVDKIKQSKVRFCNQKTNINTLYVNFKSQKLINGQQYRVNQYKKKRKNSFFYPLETGSTSTSCMTTKKPSNQKQKDHIWQNSQKELKDEDNQQFEAQLSNFQIIDAESLVDSDQKSSQTSELEYVVHSSNKLRIKNLGINDDLQYQEYQNQNQV